MHPCKHGLCMGMMEWLSLLRMCNPWCKCLPLSSGQTMPLSITFINGNCAILCLHQPWSELEITKLNVLRNDCEVFKRYSEPSHSSDQTDHGSIYRLHYSMNYCCIYERLLKNINGGEKLFLNVICLQLNETILEIPDSLLLAKWSYKLWLIANFYVILLHIFIQNGSQWKKVLLKFFLAKVSKWLSFRSSSMFFPEHWKYSFLDEVILVTSHHKLCDVT